MTCETCVVATEIAAKPIEFEPLTPKPVSVLSFVQVTVGAVGVDGEAAKTVAKLCPAHNIASAVAKTVGVGFTVILNVIGAPVQPFKVGVMVTFAI